MNGIYTMIEIHRGHVTISYGAYTLLIRKKLDANNLIIEPPFMN